MKKCYFLITINLFNVLGTKLAEAAKFNDVENSCKVMVATDAIGMGLNL